MRIRRAEPAELTAVGELTVAAYADFTLGPDDPYVTRLRDAAARASGADLWLAADDSQVLGTVTTCPVGSSWREIARDDEGEFRMLAVTPPARGRGVGDALVRHALAVFTADGIDKMVLSTLPGMTAAHRLYVRHGFAPAPHRDWSPMPGVQLLAFER